MCSGSMARNRNLTVKLFLGVMCGKIMKDSISEITA